MDYSEHYHIVGRRDGQRRDSYNSDKQKKGKKQVRFSSELSSASSGDSDQDDLGSEEQIGGNQLFEKVLRDELFYQEDVDLEEELQEQVLSMAKHRSETSQNLMQQQSDFESSSSVSIRQKSESMVATAGPSMTGLGNTVTGGAAEPRVQTVEDLIRDINEVSSHTNPYIRTRNEGAKHERRINHFSTLSELPRQAMMQSQYLLQPQQQIQQQMLGLGLGMGQSQSIFQSNLIRPVKVKRNNAGSGQNMVDSGSSERTLLTSEATESDKIKSSIAVSKEVVPSKRQVSGEFQVGGMQQSQQLQQQVIAVPVEQGQQQQRMKFHRRGAHGHTEIPKEQDFNDKKSKEEQKNAAPLAGVAAGASQYPTTRPFVLDLDVIKQQINTNQEGQRQQRSSLEENAGKGQGEGAMQSEREVASDGPQTTNFFGSLIPELPGESQQSMEQNIKIAKISNMIFKRQAKTSALINEHHQDGQNDHEKANASGGTNSEGQIHNHHKENDHQKNEKSQAELDENEESTNNDNAPQQRKSQSFNDEQMDNILTSLEHSEKKQNEANFQQAKAIANSVRQLRSNTVFYDQEKKMLFYQQLEQMSAKHNHVIVEGQEHVQQEGCVACELEEFLKNVNAMKDKQVETEITVQADPTKIYKEIPLHVIESKFYVKQTSLLKSNSGEDCHTEDSSNQVLVMGNKYHPDMRKLRVYFFDRQDVFLDAEINPKQTKIGAFIKFILKSYRQMGVAINQSLLRFHDQPARYKIFPNQGDGVDERHLADTNIPELSDNMMMIDAVGDSDVCCLVEAEEDSHYGLHTSMTSNHTVDNDPEMDLKEFSNVYNKAGEMVLKVDFKEKEFSTIIRIGKEKQVGDVIENIQRKRKIEIDKHNFLVYGKIEGDSDSFVKLDMKMPLSLIQDQYLRIDRKEYEDRPNGTVEDKIVLSKQADKGLFLKWSHPDDGDDDDDDEEDDEDEFDEYDDEDSFNAEKQTRRAAQKLAPLTQFEQMMMSKYEEFEVTKVTYVSNIIQKQSKRVIGIDENAIYNRKVPSGVLSLRSIFCFLFPGSATDTKQPQKKIDDIKDMYIIEDTNLFIQFHERDHFKYWLLFNPNPNVSKRMFEKLSFLRKTLEVRMM